MNYIPLNCPEIVGHDLPGNKYQCINWIYQNGVKKKTRFVFHRVNYGLELMTSKDRQSQKIYKTLRRAGI